MRIWTARAQYTNIHGSGGVLASCCPSLLGIVREQHDVGVNLNFTRRGSTIDLRQGSRCRQERCKDSHRIGRLSRLV